MTSFDNKIARFGPLVRYIITKFRCLPRFHDDLCAVGMEAVWQAVRSFDPLRQKKLSGWVYFIAYQKMRRELKLLRDGEKLAHNMMFIEAEPHAGKRYDDLWEAVGSLPALEQSAIYRRFAGRETLEEIADNEHVAVYVARDAIQRGLRRLRGKLADSENVRKGTDT